MNLRPRIADVYLARTVLVAALATWAVLLGFDLMTALYTELDEVGEGGYTLSHAELYTVYTEPRRLYELFPTAALIGCVLGLGGLSARSELTAMRAVGMSRLRIGLGSLLALSVVTALMVVNAETAAPYGEQNAQSVANAAKTGDVVMARVSGLWAREGNVFMNARDGARRLIDGRERTELQGVRLFEFDADGKLLSLAEARTAEHDGERWVLRDVTFDVKPGERYRTAADGPPLLAVDERLVIPAGKVVKFIVTSNDVIHSFSVGAFWTKMDANPGRLNETWVKVDQPGVYFGQCSELCGARHGYMPIGVEVVPEATFNAWLASKGGQPRAAVEAKAKADAAAAAAAADAAKVAAAAPAETNAAAATTETPAANDAAPATN